MRESERGRGRERKGERERAREIAEDNIRFQRKSSRLGLEYTKSLATSKVRERERQRVRETEKE